MEPVKSYEYQPLESENTIRLLGIKPGSFDDPIFCRVFHVNLETSPRFEALSYTWADLDGDATLSKHVSLTDASTLWLSALATNVQQLHGHRSSPSVIEFENKKCTEVDKRRPAPLAITKNCQMALRRLRFRYKRRIVWIDAICINQRDEEEKSAQVQKMRQIFASAWRVLAYIGEHKDDSKSVFKSVKYSKWLRRLKRWGVRCSLDVDASEKLFAGPWFERVWVLQETIVREKVQVICGRSRTPMDSLTKFNFLSSFIHYPTTKAGVEPPVLTPGVFWNTNDPLKILSLARQTCSTDPRDKVFGLCGLADGTLLEYVTVDYSSSVERVYINLAMSIIRKTSKLDILRHIQRRSDCDSLQLPSWVPDWSRHTNPFTELSPFSSFTPFPFWLRDLTQPSIQITEEYTSMPVLTLRGLRVDIVCAVGNNIPFISSIHRGDEEQNTFNELLERDHLVSSRFPTLFQRYLDPGKHSPVVAGNLQYESLFYKNKGDLKLFATQHSLGYGPLETLPGDIVCFLRGASNLHILRKDGDYHRNIAGCYLYGFTDKYTDLLDRILPLGFDLDGLGDMEEEFLLR